MKKILFLSITLVFALFLLICQSFNFNLLAQGGSECDQSPDCVVVNSPGNSGDYTNGRDIDHAVIKAGTSLFSFYPGQTNDGCYDVYIEGNYIEWEKVGEGSSCQDISHIQLWKVGASPSPSPTPTGQPTPTPEASLTPTPFPTEVPRGGNGDPGAPVCTDSKPNTPYLVSAVAKGANSVRVTWQQVLGSVSHYSIEYGPSSGNYLYSVVNTGNVDNFLINGLSSGCFAVRAWNNCMPGDLSNEVCTGVSGQVLGASTMAGTGLFDENLFALIFGMGSFSLGLGIRKFASNKVK